MKRLLLIGFLGLFFMPTYSSAWNYSITNKTEVNADKGDRKKKKIVKENLKIANKLIAQNKLYESIEYLKIALQADPDNAQICYKIAEIYRFSRYYNKAEEYYRTCAIKDYESFPLLYFWLGMMQKAIGEFDQAKQSYNVFMNQYKGEEAYYKNKAAKEIVACDIAAELVENPMDVDLNNLGEGINEAYSDNGAALQGEQLYFQSTRPVSTGKKIKVKGKVKGNTATYDSTFHVRMYKASKDDVGQWGNKEEVSFEIKAKEYNIGNPTISYDGSRMYFSVCKTINEKAICNVYVSEYEGSGWGKPALSKEINSKVSSTKMPYAFYDEVAQKEYLLYVSNQKGGLGKFDIYYSEIAKNGSLSEPKNLGGDINTEDNEVTPFYDPITSSLYFSSNGHLGLGELDVFKAKGSLESGFGEIENIGYPLNSYADDYYFYKSDSTDMGEKLGFISSNRSGGMSKGNPTCCDDIYGFVWRTRPAVLNLAVQGFVFNEDTKKPIDDVLVELLMAEYDSLKGSQQLKEGQKFFFDLEQDNNYYLKASKNNYAPTRVQVSTMDRTGHDTIQADIYMKEIVLDPVYYSFNDPDVMKASYEALQNLLKVMNDYPSMALQISSHTDNIGSEEYNQKLSEQRAGAVRDFLIGNNIDASRLVERAYGESMPAYPNTQDGMDYPEGRAKNRRSDFNMLTSVESVIVDQIIQREDGSTEIRATKIVLPIIYFGFDRFDITPAAEDKLAALTEVVQQHPGAIIEVSAHTDSKGSNAYNEGLSQRRAEAVMENLSGRGLRDDLIQGDWEGEERPIGSNETISGRAKNRRAQFRLIKDGEIIGESKIGNAPTSTYESEEETVEEEEDLGSQVEDILD